MSTSASFEFSLDGGLRDDFVAEAEAADERADALLRSSGRPFVIVDRKQTRSLVFLRLPHSAQRWPSEDEDREGWKNGTPSRARLLPGEPARNRAMTNLTRLATSAAIAAALFAARPVAAQEVIEISPDETVLVERYVRAAPPPPVIEEHMTLRPGSVIPEAVPLRPFEGNPSLARYSFFVSVDHKIVVTDPRTRTVVRILDQKE